MVLSQEILLQTLSFYLTLFQKQNAFNYNLFWTWMNYQLAQKEKGLQNKNGDKVLQQEKKPLRSNLDPTAPEFTLKELQSKLNVDAPEFKFENLRESSLRVDTPKHQPSGLRANAPVFISRKTEDIDWEPEENFAFQLQLAQESWELEVHFEEEHSTLDDPPCWVPETPMLSPPLLLDKWSQTQETFGDVLVPAMKYYYGSWPLENEAYHWIFEETWTSRPKENTSDTLFLKEQENTENTPSEAIWKPMRLVTDTNSNRARS